MKSDNFKNLIDENRKAFEIYDVDSQQQWEEIEQRLKNHERFSWGVWAKIAAALLILMTAFLSWYTYTNSNNVPQQVIDLEAYYGPLTSEKLQFIKSRQDIDPAILQDLDTLDKTYAALKEDLKDDVDNEEVVSAMIQTYRTKLKILEQILDEIKNESKEEDHEHEVVI